MLTRRRQILALTSILAIAGLIALVCSTGMRDPIYKGKRLSAYVGPFSEFGIGGGAQIMSGKLVVPAAPALRYPRDGETVEAIKEVGPQALPMLAQMLTGRESRLQAFVRRTTDKLPRIQKLLHIKRPSEWEGKMGALLAFCTLGTNAATAVPRIVPLLERPESADVAVLSLGQIIPKDDTKVILALTNVFRMKETEADDPNPVAIAQVHALFTLGSRGTNAAGAIPFLTGCLGLTNEYLRGAAAVALVRIGCPGKKAIPVIVANLPKTNPPIGSLPMPPIGTMSPTNMAAYAKARSLWFRKHTGLLLDIWTLGEYGAQAQSALPSLTNLLTYPSVNVQNTAAEVAAHIRDSVVQRHRSEVPAGNGAGR